MSDMIISIIGVGIAVALFVIGIVVDHGISDDEDKDDKEQNEKNGEADGNDRKRHY